MELVGFLDQCPRTETVAVTAWREKPLKLVTTDEHAENETRGTRRSCFEEAEASRLN